MTSPTAGWNDVYIDLEMRIEPKIFDKGWFSKNDMSRFSAARETAKRRMRQDYPEIYPAGFEVKKRSAHLYAVSTPEEFRRIFGNNIKLGVFLSQPSSNPISLPGLHVRWYQTGELAVPSGLSDLVKGARIKEPKERCVQIYKPRAAKQFEKRNDPDRCVMGGCDRRDRSEDAATQAAARFYGF